MNLDALFMAAYKLKASDLHILEGQAPYMRVSGNLKKVDMPPLEHSDLEGIFDAIMPDRSRKEFLELMGSDFSYQFRDLNRYRVVAFMFQGKWGLTMRLIPMQPFTLEELNMPEVIYELSMIHRGMVLLTGITGSGKSTTLAAMLQHMNQNDARRVITIEDPIEFMYTSEKSLFSQREVGIDVPDFGQGLRHALRMDPDVILIGEMRDIETIGISIKAAETGHLLMSTLHTTGAVHTLQRILGYFPQDQHEVLLEQLSLNLKASITQRLVRKRDGKGRAAAQEIMVVNQTVAKLIKEGRVLDVFGVIRGRADGMRLFDQSLADFVREKEITFEEATKYCEDFYALRRYIAGITSSGDAGGVL